MLENVGKMRTKITPNTDTFYAVVIISPGQKSDSSTLFSTETSVSGYEQLCSLDVLGIYKDYLGHAECIYDKFKKQRTCSADG